MEFFIWLLGSVLVIVSGYYAGDAFDVQYRQPGLMMKRVSLPKKYQWLFHFRRITANDVLLVGVIIEAVALSAAIMMMIIFVIHRFIAFTVYYEIMIGIIGLYCFFLLCLSIVVTVTCGLRHRKGVRCLQCEFRKAFTSETIFSSVIIVDELQRDSLRIYQIKYGKIVPRIYEAVAVSNFAPCIGDKCNAIYRSQYPFFLLVPDSREI